MFAYTRLVHRIPRFSAAAKRHFATTRMTMLDRSKPFEEESLPWYSPDQFYPVRIGEVFESQYKVVGKLGYGANSTVWLCRDLRS